MPRLYMYIHENEATSDLPLTIMMEPPHVYHIRKNGTHSGSNAYTGHIKPECFFMLILSSCSSALSTHSTYTCIILYMNLQIYVHVYAYTCVCYINISRLQLVVSSLRKQNSEEII